MKLRSFHSPHNPVVLMTILTWHKELTLYFSVTLTVQSTVLEMFASGSVLVREEVLG